VGLSTNEQDFSRAVFKDLVERGYDIVPVNPKAERIADRDAFATIQAIPGSVGWVLVMTPPDATAAVVDDAHAAGVDHVWLHRGVGQGAVSDDAVALAQQHGMTLVAGECPLMFLGKPGFPHNVHAFFKKVAGHYPKRAEAKS
jgi:predicted CoA-binding protein